jgi:hypothetical protein
MNDYSPDFHFRNLEFENESLTDLEEGSNYMPKGIFNSF